LLGVAPLLAIISLACGSGGEKEESATSVCDGSVSEVQVLVSSVVEGVPGFAGCAPDPDNPGGYIINVTSPDVDPEAARAAILSQAGTSDVIKTAELRAVQLDTSGIREWYQQAHNGLLTELPDHLRLEWRYWGAGIDEVHNQGRLWYANEEAFAWAQNYILEEVDAPPGVIVAIFKSEPQED
jgi:hypothetical protein